MASFWGWRFSKTDTRTPTRKSTFEAHGSSFETNLSLLKIKSWSSSADRTDNFFEKSALLLIAPILHNAKSRSLAGGLSIAQSGIYQVKGSAINASLLASEQFHGQSHPPNSAQRKLANRKTEEQKLSSLFLQPKNPPQESPKRILPIMKANPCRHVFPKLLINHEDHQHKTYIHSLETPSPSIALSTSVSPSAPTARRRSPYKVFFFFLFHHYTVMAENPSSFLRQRTATLPFSPLHGEGREPFFLSRQRTATLPFSPLHGEGREPFFLSGREPQLFLFHHSTMRAEYPSSFLTTPRVSPSAPTARRRSPYKVFFFFLFHHYTVMAENPSSFLRQRTATLPFSPLHGEGREPFFLSRQRTATLPFSPLHGEGREPFFLSRQRTATLPFSPLHDEGRVPFFLSHHSTTLLQVILSLTLLEVFSSSFLSDCPEITRKNESQQPFLMWGQGSGVEVSVESCWSEGKQRAWDCRSGADARAEWCRCQNRVGTASVHGSGCEMMQNRDCRSGPDQHPSRVGGRRGRISRGRSDSSDDPLHQLVSEPGVCEKRWTAEEEPTPPPSLLLPIRFRDSLPDKAIDAAIVETHDLPLLHSPPCSTSSSTPPEQSRPEGSSKPPSSSTVTATAYSIHRSHSNRDHDRDQDHNLTHGVQRVPALGVQHNLPRPEPDSTSTVSRDQIRDLPATTLPNLTPPTLYTLLKTSSQTFMSRMSL
ncbi:hypothetical protein M5K25_018489 [Dendrobium thyrsiflorum]|uniref:Uncharacterized protein n=1 Tax=Dendrobium thyrsiflorum TaxID=117978 RepID=A0ABD0UI72_DENTH